MTDISLEYLYNCEKKKDYLRLSVFCEQCVNDGEF